MLKAVVSQQISKRIKLMLIPLETMIGAAQAVPRIEKVIAGTGQTEEERMMARIMKVAMGEMDQMIRQRLPQGRPEPIHPDTVIVNLSFEEYEKLGKPVPLDVVVLVLKVEAEPVG